jgi:secondary thiamine-phosphate synthase enzyme
MHTTFTLKTRGPGLCEFTHDVQAFVDGAGRASGLVTLFVPHTSCSLLIQENADLDVRRDLQAFFQRLAPPSDDASMHWIRHRAEGPDDMPAHIKASLLPTFLAIPLIAGRLALGTWQGIYLFEHRDEPQSRSVVANIS